MDEDMAADPQDQAWPQSDAVAVAPMQHRRLGKWAIDTINPDGWANTLEYLKLTSADFVVGQEVKRATKLECDEAE